MSLDLPGGMPRALLAVPGSIASPTGGYAYARALLARSRACGLILDHWPLPEGFPAPDHAALDEARRRVSAMPSGWPVIVDGLALGRMPAEVIAEHDGPVLALCHHPLGLETGLDPDTARRLVASETAALAACAQVITTSRATADTLVARFGVDAERITVAHPGTDPAPRARGSDGPGVAILSVGSLTPRKGHDLLIEALAGLGDLDWRLTIVGPPSDPATAEALAAQAARSGVADRVAFAGAASAAELDAHYDRADLFVLASRYEGFGMAYAEAMARGLPVVGCESGAVAEATLGAALLVPTDDADALKTALGPLIADAGSRAALAAACEAAAARLPRWDDTVERIARAVEAACRKAPSAPA